MRLIAHMAVLLLFSANVCRADKVQWAKGAVHFGHECRTPHTSCILAKVASPDAKYTARVRLIDGNPVAEIISGGKYTRLDWSFDPEIPFVEMEIFWSPDSSAVSFAWNENAITEFSRVYAITTHGPKLVDLHPVMASMAKDFPPCVDDPYPCRLSKAGEDYNYLSVAWSAPHTVVLMAEVPSSSSFGRNMGQVNGYELDTVTGQITRLMKPLEFKKRWERQMGWRFSIPETP